MLNSHNEQLKKIISWIISVYMSKPWKLLALQGWVKNVGKAENPDTSIVQTAWTYRKTRHWEKFWQYFLALCPILVLPGERWEKVRQKSVESICYLYLSNHQLFQYFSFSWLDETLIRDSFVFAVQKLPKEANKQLQRDSIHIYIRVHLNSLISVKRVK